MNQNIMPIFREHSKFYQKYSNVPVPEMLRLHGFIVDEMPIDEADIVYMEEYKNSLLKMGIIVDEVPFKKEFVAQYVFHGGITSLMAEGQYLRKPNGDKMYNSYYFYLYKEGFQTHKGHVRERVYVEKAIKSTFLKTFESCLGLLRVGGEYEFKEN